MNRTMHSRHRRHVHFDFRRTGLFHHRYWFFLTAFVGLNSAFTKWCLMEDILEKLGVARKS